MQKKQVYIIVGISKSGISSSLYIYKWRVPTPVPSSIDVSVRFRGEYEPQEVMKINDFKNNPANKEKPIVEYVYNSRENTKTIRYDADGYYKPFTSIYLPKFMVDHRIQENSFQVIIDWC
jgi:hypothetical protein